MWTFVGHKKRKVWLWLAVERASRRIVAWTLGSRGQASARRLWQQLPWRYRRCCWYFTDEWKAYAAVLPRYQHRPCPKGEGQTNHCRGRQLFLASLQRRACAKEVFVQQMPANAHGPN